MLDSPGNLSATATNTTICISWMPPFSLNLTNADPDIIYCVDVYNVTGGGLHHLTNDCHVITPTYTFTVENPDPRDQFKFTVTPRSNVEGAKNGTPSHAVANFQMYGMSL